MRERRSPDLLPTKPSAEPAVQPLQFVVRENAQGEQTRLGRRVLVRVRSATWMTAMTRGPTLSVQEEDVHGTHVTVDMGKAR